MTATANINNMRIIATVMGEPDSKMRNDEISSIFDYVYSQYKLEKIIDKEKVLKTIDIEGGKVDTIDIVSIKDITSLYKISSDKPNISYDIKIDKFKLPIKQGDVVGKLILKENGISINTIDLTVKDEVKKANIFELFWKNLKIMLGN